MKNATIIPASLFTMQLGYLLGRHRTPPRTGAKNKTITIPSSGDYRRGLWKRMGTG